MKEFGDYMGMETTGIWRLQDHGYRNLEIFKDSRDIHLWLS